jgi:hypothetical protein
MTDPKNVARGKRSRSSGLRYQREVRKRLEEITGTKATKFAPLGGSEENWIGLPWKVEVKSGAQVNPAFTVYGKMLMQCETNLPGDERLFVGVIKVARKPALVLIALDDLADLLKEW